MVKLDWTEKAGESAGNLRREIRVPKIPSGGERVHGLDTGVFFRSE